MNPSGGSGTTTDPAYTGSAADNPAAFVSNSTLIIGTENAHDGQDFTFTYNDLSGDDSDDWAIINLPNDLITGNTVNFNYRDPMSGFIGLVEDFNTYPGATYTTYTMSFGRTVEIITHIS